jgi:hypothetical protein
MADWHLLGFKWQGKWYYERVLPFGLRSSCRLWELYAAALHFFIQFGIEVVVIHYVDDFLLVSESCERATGFRAAVERLCARLGIPMAADKTEGPVQALTFLGIYLDTVSMRASIPNEKLVEIQELIATWMGKSSASIRELQSLTGLLNFAAQVVPAGRFYLRRIIDHTTHLGTLTSSGKTQCQLTPAVMADVAWWGEFLPRWNGVSLLLDAEWTDAALIELYTDACDKGQGARWGDQWFESRWTPQQLAAAFVKSRISMPFLELHALVQAAATWGPQWERKKITFRSDCMPVVEAINKHSSKKPAMMHLLRQFSTIAATHHFDFRCIHVPGVRNVVADILSRDGDCAQFRTACPTANPLPTPIVEISLPPPHSPPSSAASSTPPSPSAQRAATPPRSNTSSPGVDEWGEWPQSP